MKNVAIPGPAGVTTALGFGCARLLRLPLASNRERLLATAFDGGIRHFDVARMYGLGAAEGELGRFLKGKRDQVTIATKVGLSPAKATNLLRPFQSVIRGLMQRQPFLRRLIRGAARNVTRSREFAPAQVTASLETSLRELRTDYVDFVLLHEPRLDDFTDSALSDCLLTLRHKGRIGAVGVAGDLHEVSAVIAARPELGEVLQVPVEALLQEAAQAQGSHTILKIGYSPFARHLDPVIAHFKRYPDEASAWSSRLGLDLTARGELARVLLECFAQENAAGITLFSATQPEQVRQLLAAAHGPLPKEDLKEFGKYVIGTVTREKSSAP